MQSKLPFDLTNEFRQHKILGDVTVRNEIRDAISEYKIGSNFHHDIVSLRKSLLEYYAETSGNTRVSVGHSHVSFAAIIAVQRAGTWKRYMGVRRLAVAGMPEFMRPFFNANVRGEPVVVLNSRSRFKLACKSLGISGGLIRKGTNMSSVLERYAVGSIKQSNIVPELAKLNKSNRATALVEFEKLRINGAKHEDAKLIRVLKVKKRVTTLHPKMRKFHTAAEWDALKSQSYGKVAYRPDSWADLSTQEQHSLRVAGKHIVQVDKDQQAELDKFEKDWASMSDIQKEMWFMANPNKCLDKATCKLVKGSYVPDLTICGDVESQPGPIITGPLVVWNRRAFYDRYYNMNFYSRLNMTLAWIRTLPIERQLVERAELTRVIDIFDQREVDDIRMFEDAEAFERTMRHREWMRIRNTPEFMRRHHLQTLHEMEVDAMSVDSDEDMSSLMDPDEEYPLFERDLLEQNGSVVGDQLSVGYEVDDSMMELEAEVEQTGDDYLMHIEAVVETYSKLSVETVHMLADESTDPDVATMKKMDNGDWAALVYLLTTNIFPQLPKINTSGKFVKMCLDSLALLKLIDALPVCDTDYWIGLFTIFINELGGSSAKVVLHSKSNGDFSDSVVDKATVKGFFETMSQSELISHLKKCFLVIGAAIVSASSLIDFPKKVLMYFGMFKIATDVPDLCDCMFKLAEIFQDQIVPSVVNWDFSYLKPNVLKKKLVAICTFTNSLGVGFTHDSMVDCLNEWKETQNDYFGIDDHQLKLELLPVVTEMTDFLVRCSTDSSTGSISTYIQQVSQAKYMLINSINASKRMQPFCFAIWGSAGTGKTTFCQSDVVAALTKPLGLPLVNFEGRCQPVKPVVLVPTQNFQECCTESTMVVMFDDIGQIKQKPGANPEANLFFNIQSNASVQIEQAAIINKKDKFWNNKLTLVTSNARDFGMTGMIESDPAFRRRINVMAEVQFSDVSHVGIDVTLTVLDIKHARNVDYNTHHCVDWDEAREYILTHLIIEAEIHVTAQRDIVARLMDRGEMCPNCKLPLLKCACDKPQVITPEGAVSALSSSPMCFISPMLRHLPDDFTKLLYFVVAGFLEELSCISLFLQFRETFKNDFNIPEFIVWCWLLFLFRISVDLVLNPALSYDYRWLCSQFFMTYLSLYCSFWPTLIFHVLFNCCVYADFMKSTKIYFMRQLRDYINTLFGRYVYMAENNSIDLNPTIENTVIDISEFVKTKLYNSAPSWIVTILMCVAPILAAKMLYKTMFVTAFDEATGFNTESTSGDKGATACLQSMVKSSNVSVQDGRANSWSQKNHAIFKKGNGTIHKGISSCVATVRIVFIKEGKTNEFEGFGFYADEGYFYTVDHGMRNLPKDSMIFMTFPNGSIKKYCIDKEDKRTFQVGVFDSVRIPMQFSNNSVRTHFDYVPEIDHVYMINKVKCKPIGRLEPRQMMCNGVLTDEPEGSVLTDMPSQEGFSGLPVFLVGNEAGDVDPRFIGIVHTMHGVTKQAIFVPLSFGDKATMLHRAFTVESVQAHFKNMGYPLNPEMDSHSVGNHLSSEEFEGVGEYCGSLKKRPQVSTSTFYQTSLYDKALAFCPEIDTLGIPRLHSFKQDGVYIDSTLACLRQMASKGKIENPSVFLSAAHILFDFYADVLKDDLMFIAPLTVKEVIRGTTYMNPLNLKSSMGFPYNNMIKDDVISGTLEEPCFVEWYAHNLQCVLMNIDNGTPCMNISVACIKDEVISKDKILKGLERIYFAGGADYLMLCRMYLGPYMDLFMARRNKLAPQIGMNASGGELHERLLRMFEMIEGKVGNLHDFLVEKGWIDKDYDKYDKRLLVIAFSTYVVWLLVQITPFYQQPCNSVELNRIRSLLQSRQQYIVIIGNDVYLMDTGAPSGSWGTTWWNCIDESLLEIVQFYFLIHYNQCAGEPTFCNFVMKWKQPFPFFKHVALVDYGDDNLVYVSRSVRCAFTHEAIMAFAKFICMGITPARKTETTITFKVVTDVLFLKRTPTWDPRIQRLVGRLEYKSIGKMLAFTNSRDPSWERMVLMQATREMASYSFDDFERFKHIFGVVADQNDVIDLVMDTKSWSDDLGSNVIYLTTLPAVPGLTNLTVNYNYEDQLAGLV